MLFRSRRLEAEIAARAEAERRLTEQIELRGAAETRAEHHLARLTEVPARAAVVTRPDPLTDPMTDPLTDPLDGPLGDSLGDPLTDPLPVVEPEPAPEPEPEPAPEPVLAERPSAPVVRVGPGELPDPGPQRSGSGGRIAIWLLAVVAAAAAAGLYLDTRTASPAVIGLAAVAAVLLVVLVVRRRGASAHVRVDDAGVVEIVRGEQRHRFDLYSSATMIETHGRPGDADWEVRFLRRSLPPVIVDRRMVDAEEFTREVQRWRPDL